ncbi:Gcd10p family-domain-containing protein [Sphaerosporella brunnea]|uniref:tRNA (adenine(58)-N(1))-methyltransferase non-catalytic subunit TRM6 n=1 Tax=Sphaerosporella brunnea TaxID=1250544 RepID=A0A5J5F443_9PEZI|nr:Gcd10p family-domain-containing protein [Sphaerosporella brunnea]
MASVSPRACPRLCASPPTRPSLWANFKLELSLERTSAQPDLQHFRQQCGVARGARGRSQRGRDPLRSQLRLALDAGPMAEQAEQAEKTPFSLRKYTLRKASEFPRRFSAHRLTVNALTDYLPTQKEPQKFQELKNYHLGMTLSLGNIVRLYGGRYLFIDEIGGLLVAAVAERLGILSASSHHLPTRRIPSPTTVEDTRKGGYDAVPIAAYMPVGGILKAVVPLVKGSGQVVVVYEPSPEPATEIADFYSRARKSTKRRRRRLRRRNPGSHAPTRPHRSQASTCASIKSSLEGHTPIWPAEGFIVHATRVIPDQGKVDTRGAYASQKKKRKLRRRRLR